MGGVDGFLPSKASSFCAIEEEARPRLPDAGAFFMVLKIPRFERGGAFSRDWSLAADAFASRGRAVVV